MSGSTTPTHAGGIVLRDGPRGTLVLLIRARSDPTLWIFPKGHVDPGESPQHAALREVREEAGVAATIIRRVDDMPIASGMAAIYLMRYITDVPPAEQRECLWCTAPEAQELLTYSDSRAVLARALAPRQ
ncbi:MAG: Diadenosine hexaphosphate hydrolase [Phycisphaerae bacterium]|nr:Diadenosine hexaphosphate hydrolase [Phycisphaerae bacterium]